MGAVCEPLQLEFQGFCGKPVVARQTQEKLTSDAGALVLREAGRQLGLFEAMAGCVKDFRDAQRVVYPLEQLMAQRVVALAMGWEDVNDHDRLREDPLWAVVGDNREGACAGKGTLNRLECSVTRPLGRYHRFEVDLEAMQGLLVEMFIRSWSGPAPEELVLDLDATDVPMHGGQEGRQFHGYYDHHCVLPLYLTCGDWILGVLARPGCTGAAEGFEQLLDPVVARLRRAWPGCRIIVRGDSGFSTPRVLDHVEQQGLGYIFGLARNARLERKLAPAMARAKSLAEAEKAPRRVFSDFGWQTKASWPHPRRVVGKAEWLCGGEGATPKANPRFVVTNIEGEAGALYQRLYCQRGAMENQIKAQQLDLFAGRLSCHFLRENQLRLLLSALAAVLVNRARQGLRGTQLERATASTLRQKVLKCAAVISISTRRVLLRLGQSADIASLGRMLRGLYESPPAAPA